MSKSWLELHCALLVPIEQQTIEVLGEETAGFFVNATDDCLSIIAAVTSASPGEQNLMLFTLLGLFKEACWFHSSFVSGNYPLLLSRLRFLWESMFRAYFAEHYPLDPCKKWEPPGRDKIAWLEEHDKDLRWDTCIEPVLRAVFSISDREAEVRDHYHELFKYLHRYAHPSAYLLDRMIDDSSLHVKDGFDERWAKQTAETGAKVFDLVWMVVFARHPAACERVELLGKYPVVNGLIEKGTGKPSG